jgi:hypothetical protein
MANFKFLLLPFYDFFSRLKNPLLMSLIFLFLLDAKDHVMQLLINCLMDFA